MLDAWAKPPEGIFSGHVNALGDFDECLAVRAPSKQNANVAQFQGKYCVVYVMPNVSTEASSLSPGSDGVKPGERSFENIMVGNLLFSIIIQYKNRNVQMGRSEIYGK